MIDLIQTLRDRFAGDPNVYVSGNILLFYEEGNKRKHVSPDLLFTRGIPKRDRLYYLAWLEGKMPDVVFEITSKTTKSEDRNKKKNLYRDVLAIPEYFLFDPFEDYLKPSLQGYRRVAGEYEPIALVEGRLRSEVLGLDLERHGIQLRLRDPETNLLLPTRIEVVEAEREKLEAERAKLETERREREAERQRADAAEAELARLRAELEALRLGSDPRN
jgi:Uma2 family endonuclease